MFKTGFFCRLIGIGLILLSAPITEPAAWGFEFKGFADVIFTQSSIDPALDPAGRNGSFALGQLDLFMVQPLENRLEVLSELVVETNKTGESVIDLERLRISYHFSDSLQFHVGRFHNILGYWNTAYHHAALFYTSIDRPGFLSFEDDGGILPVHLVGAWVSGIVVTEPVELDYGLMVGNGALIDNSHDHHQFELNPGNISDSNKNKAISVNLTFKPSIPGGLGLGIFGNFSQIPIVDTSPTPMPMVQVDQSILGADLFYDNSLRRSKGLELLSEFYRITDKDADMNTGRFVNSAYYVQAGYRITEQVLPYLRYEQVRIKSGDPYFTSLGTTDSNAWVYGLRFSINPASALKGEVRVKDLVGMDRYTEYAAQWAFGF